MNRELQHKAQAAPGDVNGVNTNPRWIGSGWTIYNNKSKPFKSYEPFFSGTQEFEIDLAGVSSTLFYDPPGRVIGALHPNQTYEKVVFDAWEEITWDVNDTLNPTRNTIRAAPIRCPITPSIPRLIPTSATTLSACRVAPICPPGTICASIPPRRC